MAGTVWKIVGTSGSVAVGIMANKILGSLWKKGRGGEPPLNPESGDTSWAEAITWAVLSGAVVGIARLAFRRNAASYYRSSTGHLPAGVDQTS